jgi:shikimate dehydrogenase
MPLPINPDNFERGIEGLKALGVAGFNVTIPYKERIIEYLDVITDDAFAIGAVNTVKNVDNQYYGYNTDIDGFINSMELSLGWGPDGKSVVIFGAGGASRAVLYGCIKGNAKSITIVNRTLEKARDMVDSITSNISYNPIIKISTFKEVNSIIPYGDTFINTLPIDPPFDITMIKEESVLVDISYYRKSALATVPNTSFLDGLPMLIHQGILSFEIWTGMKPSLKGIENAIKAVLGGETK